MFNENKQRSLALRLRAMRAICSLTQDTLSLAAGLDRSTLSYYESGHMYPSLSKLCLLASLFGISLDELLGEGHLPDPLLRDDNGESDPEEALDFQEEDEDRFKLPEALPLLKTEEQLLVLYYRQLMDKDKHEFLSKISEAAEEMQRLLIDPNDEDIILVEDLELPDETNSSIMRFEE